MARMNPDGLNEQQERFCQEYLVDLNGKHAAIRAGYSEATAQEQASRLLSHAKVEARVQELMEQREKRTEVTQDQVLAELARVAFYKPSRVLRVSGDGEVDVDYRKASPDDLDMVLETKRSYSKEGGSYSLKRMDKMKALELLGRHLGMFKDKVEHSGDIPTSTAVIIIPQGQREAAGD